MSDAIELLREHAEKNRHKGSAYFSIKNLTVLLTMLDDLHTRWLECCSNSVALTHQRDELKAQVERLLAKEGERIAEAMKGAVK